MQFGIKIVLTCGGIHPTKCIFPAKPVPISGFYCNESDFSLPLVASWVLPSTDLMKSKGLANLRTGGAVTDQGHVDQVVKRDA